MGANKERALTDWREDERVRREAAEGDEVVPGSSESVEPTRLQQLISVRLDPELIAARARVRRNNAPPLAPWCVRPSQSS